jgi:hypothetical protein
LRFAEGTLVPAKAMIKKQKREAGMSKKSRTDAAMAQGRAIYMLELARGSSHIASTRKPETRDRAIAEVLEGFGEVHGLQRLDIFRELLAEDTERRGHLEAAAAVRHFGQALPGTAKKMPVAKGRRKKTLAIAEGQGIGQNLRDGG